ncbi:MAG: hypothetical protein FWD31_06565 [Planctomycetaceae bacterium]|nr:hypothetical protein [Planctomycetaceae bacterium]
MKKTYTSLIIMIFANIIMASNTWVSSFTNDWFSAASVNSTNIVIKYPPSGSGFLVSYDRCDYTINSYLYSPDDNEDYLVTTNRITQLSNGWIGVSYEFTPVSFTNKITGFKIVHRWTGDPPWDYVLNGPNVLSNVFYVALSDTPVEVGEGDVEGELDISEPEKNINPWGDE